MSGLADLDLAQLLPHAFDRAWERYDLDPNGELSKDDIRVSLARRLITAAREGETDERALAASGFLHLISLTEPSLPVQTAAPDESVASPDQELTLFHLRIDNVKARFLRPWRITRYQSKSWDSR